VNKLLDFLYEEKALKAFNQEYFDQSEDKDARAYIIKHRDNQDAIMDAFVFKKSFNGFKYWKDINIKWEESFHENT